MVGFLLHARGQKIPSPAVFGQITNAFKTNLRAWCQAQGIPWIEFRKGERKDDVVERYRARFPHPHGVVLVEVARERASGWYVTKTRHGCHVHEFFPPGTPPFAAGGKAGPAPGGPPAPKAAPPAAR